jgi:hypothetical protein
MPDRRRLAELTHRWRARHDAGSRAAADRPPATAEREALAATAFPFRDRSPADYVAEHGAAMIGFTYDDERYADADLDAWLVEVGRLLHARREA